MLVGFCMEMERGHIHGERAGGVTKRFSCSCPKYELLRESYLSKALKICKIKMRAHGIKRRLKCEHRPFPNNKRRGAECGCQILLS